ncbi:MAG: hypothetical protein ABIE42_05570 [Candidatus Eisenbacteria bacterium]
MKISRRHDLISSGRPVTNAGITTVELMIAGFISAIVLIAAFTMYLTSMDTWDVSGARLALQRNGDRTVKQIASDIRHGDMVVVGADSTSIDITRTIAGATDTLQAYALSGDEVVNKFGTVLTNNVTGMRFSSGNGVKVWISITLTDDMGTSALPFDDQRVEINSVAVCRNEPS